MNRGSGQRRLAESHYCNPFTVAVCGRAGAIAWIGQHFLDDASLRSCLWSISGLQLICHCLDKEHGHANVLILEFSPRIQPHGHETVSTFISGPTVRAFMKSRTTTMGPERTKMLQSKALVGAGKERPCRWELGSLTVPMSMARHWHLWTDGPSANSAIQHRHRGQLSHFGPSHGGHRITVA